MSSQKELVTLPTIYDEFQCKGNKCRNTCCQKWRIDISRAEYNKVRHCLSPEQAKTLFKRVPRQKADDFHYATMQYNEKGFCPLLSEDGLCTLQVEHGYQILPQVCKQFPRMLEKLSPTDYSLALDTGCERTLELLWKHSQSGIKFVTREQSYTLYSSEKPEHLFSEFGSDIRNLCIWLLQNRSYSLSDRMLILGLAMRELQQIQDTGAIEHVPAWFIKWQAQTKGDILKDALSKLNGNRNLFVLNNIKTLLPLIPRISMGSDWLSTFAKHFSFTVKEDIVSFDLEQYNTVVAQFEERFPNIDNFFENYMVLTLFRKTFPFEQKTVWQSYISIIAFYSLLCFLSITTVPQTAEQLIDTLTAYSRSSLNADSFSKFTTSSLQNYNSDSLAHLAILIRG